MKVRITLTIFAILVLAGCNQAVGEQLEKCTPCRPGESRAEYDERSEREQQLYYDYLQDRDRESDRERDDEQRTEWQEEQARSQSQGPNNIPPSLYDCDDFASQKEAQQFFEANDGPYEDPYVLDEDRDGVACEWNP